MKTAIKSLLLFILSVNFSFSQTGWIHQNSNTGKTLADVFFINDQKGWIVTDSTKILMTTNSGMTWSAQTLPYYYPLRTIFFINENTGWAAGGYNYIVQFGAVFKTINGGVNWNLISHTGNVQSIYFINENTGFAGLDESGDFESGGSILKTTNGGVNWNYTFYNYIFSSVAFKDQQTGFAVGHYWDDTGHDTSLILRTTDAGNSWDTKYKEGNNFFNFSFGLRDIFVKDNKVWASGVDSSILYSSDGGDSWSRQYVPVPQSMYSIQFVDQNTGWAVGGSNADTSNIIKTTNGGLDWFNQKSSNNGFSWLYSVMFLDANTGWAVGDYGIILKTTTGGLTFINNTYSEIPGDYQLHQNYPNPFNPATSIKFEIPSSGNVSLKVYDQLGSEIKTLTEGYKPAGAYEVNFNAEGLSSGVYYYTMISGSVSLTKKMLLIR
ncbi:MAG: T9SS type A sorting domain-containing protein [Ignavibacteria bacterium]|nr:T9SS type A sorting domain-containing protein [Ignavibacteria bacterium]